MLPIITYLIVTPDAKVCREEILNVSMQHISHVRSSLEAMYHMITPPLSLLVATLRSDTMLGSIAVASRNYTYQLISKDSSPTALFVQSITPACQIISRLFDERRSRTCTTTISQAQCDPLCTEEPCRPKDRGQNASLLSSSLAWSCHTSLASTRSLGCSEQGQEGWISWLVCPSHAGMGRV
ncbi:hypothetical protein CC79DRAFT_203807 [Sarocladium strictum]